ncbi:MAG: hypothetical protein QM755_06770 [Luteolibacter sp.]
MKTILLLLLSGGLPSWLTAGNEPPHVPAVQWSEAVNGLQARLIVEARKEVLPGTMQPEIYLELHNVSEVNGTIDFDFEPYSFKPGFFDGTRKRAMGSVTTIMSGFANPSFRVALPRDGTMRFPLTWKGYGIGKGMGVMVCLENGLWNFAKDDKSEYYLCGSLVIEKGAPVGGIDRLWHGSLKVPAVKVPVSEKK